MRRTEEVVRRLRRECAFNAGRGPRALIDALRAEIDELERAVEGGARWSVVDELGDVLFNVVSLAAALTDAHGVTLAEADEHAARKMTGRHPYVFGDADDPGPAEAARQWDERKRAEEAERLSRRAAVVGTGTATLPAASAGVSADRLAEALTRALAPFEDEAAPEPATRTTADGRSATVWAAAGGRVLAYTFIAGPATGPDAVGAAIRALDPTEHATHVREVTRV